MGDFVKNPIFLYNKHVMLFKKRFYLFIFRERVREGGREGEREGEKDKSVVASCVPLLGTWPVTQACALIGNQTGDSLVCSPRSIHWATPARATCNTFIIKKNLFKVRECIKMRIWDNVPTFFGFVFVFFATWLWWKRWREILMEMEKILRDRGRS